MFSTKIVCLSRLNVRIHAHSVEKTVSDIIVISCLSISQIDALLPQPRILKNKIFEERKEKRMKQSFDMKKSKPYFLRYEVEEVRHRNAAFGDNETEMELKTYEWVYIDPDFNSDDNLDFAFKFGQDEEGNDIYAARAPLDGDIIPAYYVPQKRAVIAPWGFKSHRITNDIELLDISNDEAEYKWVAASNGGIPENAFGTGNTIMGDILYTARAEYDGTILYGKLHQRYNLAYMPYKGKEISNQHYEILVRIPKQTTTPSLADT